jgi:hypothetical protein
MSENQISDVLGLFSDLKSQIMIYDLAAEFLNQTFHWPSGARTYVANYLIARDSNLSIQGFRHSVGRIFDRVN